jgi:hypothetical protein
MPISIMIRDMDVSDVERMCSSREEYCMKPLADSLPDYSQESNSCLDDVPMELIDEIQKMYPDMEIQFAGQPGVEIPEEIQEKIKLMEAQFKFSVANGTCLDCGIKIPGEWPPSSDDYKYPDGWSMFHDITDDSPMGLQCPGCDAVEMEQEGNPQEI